MSQTSDVVMDESNIDDVEEDSNQGIVEIACGSDFVLCLKSDGNVYGIGLNKCG